MKITDLKCSVIGQNPVIRINTDEGIYGYGQAENTKPYLKPHVLFYKNYLIGEDPTNVERVMMKIRRMGSFKPWGSAVSAIEMALWDIAGKAAGIPVYKLLGGKTRDKVRVYNGGVRFPMTGYNPEDYAEDMRKMKAAAEGFTIIKSPISFHSSMPYQIPNFSYDEPRGVAPQGNPYFQPKGGMIAMYDAPHANRGLLTEKSMKHIIACVEAMKSVLGDEIGLALDCGPGWMVTDAIRVARALEPLNIMWMEDLITGDYTPYTLADVYREVTQATSTPTHTGEQIYLRQNFKELIERHAVRVIGPDPEDIGGLAELKWVTEYADLHGIMIAPHGVFDGLIGLAALVQVCATLPQNYIAFEYPIAKPEWWYEIIEGLPNPIVKDGLIEVWDAPGLGLDFKVDQARQYLAPEDQDFFD
jgi:L-alanine-DL-glutamate epimerase-like enolase superfamily enzyme